jgi:intein-encoded DNA endonuclease-like protein
MKETKSYVVCLVKDKDFNEVSVNEWIEKICTGRINKHETKKQIQYTFSDMDDAFRFKLHWGRA